MSNRRAYLLKGISYLALMGIAILGIIFLSSDFKWNPFERISLENTTNVTMDRLGNTYLMSDSNRTINKISKDQRVIYQLEGGNRKEEGFYLANDFTTDPQGNLYVLASMWDESGSFIETEKIIQYDPNGKFVDTLFILEDETESKLIPVIKGMDYGQGKLHWFILTASEIEYWEANSDSAKSGIPYENAAVMIQEVESYGDSNVLYLSKDGFVFQYDLSNHKADTLLAPTPESIGARSNLWDIEVARSGQIFLNDLGRFGIYKLENQAFLLFWRVIRDKVKKKSFIIFISMMKRLLPLMIIMFLFSPKRVKFQILVR